MSDARETGSMEDGRQPQPVTIDLTRIDIRRGTIHLPRRFLGILSGGERQAEDTVRGETLSVTFNPPRELHGLTEFFARHELRPNDALTLRISDGQLSLTPIKRERRKVSEQERGRYADSPPPAPAEIPEVRRENVNAEQGAFEAIVRERRIDARDRSSYSESGSWQSVLHSPRRARAAEGDEVRAGAAEQAREQRGAAAERSPRAQASGQQPRPLDASPPDTGRGDTWRLSPRDRAGAERAAPLGPQAGPDRWRREQPDGGRESVGDEPEGLVREVKREHPGRGLPLARNEAPQERLFGDTPRAAGTPAAAEAAPAVKPEERPVKEQPVPVAVGAGAGQDAAREVAGYLYSPAAPAIVRATEVAEKLGLPADETKKALQQVARNSDGAITAIRQDVYLVKRSS